MKLACTPRTTHRVCFTLLRSPLWVKLWMRAMTWSFVCGSPLLSDLTYRISTILLYFLSFQNSTVVICFCHLCLLLIILYRAEVEHIFTTYVTHSNSNMCVFINSNYATFRGSFHCGITYCNISTEQHPGCDRNNRLIIVFPVLLDSILHSPDGISNIQAWISSPVRSRRQH